MVPRIIHQIWLGGGDGLPAPPGRLEEASGTWARHHPGWEIRRWSGDEIEDLFARHRPDLLETYLGYRYYVQRVDAARYLILWVHGGLYADLDVACVRPVEPLIEADLVLAPTEPWGVSIDFMLARPRHPLMARTLDGLPAADRRWNRPWIPQYLRVMCGTGSLRFSLDFHRMPDPGPVRLLTEGEYGHGDPGQALVEHRMGNSWHSPGSRALVLVWSRWKLILAAGALAAAAWLVVG